MNLTIARARKGGNANPRLLEDWAVIPAHQANGSTSPRITVSAAPGHSKPGPGTRMEQT
jgi:hypothetical protein